MLAPLMEVHPDDPMSSLSVRARDMYPDLADTLMETTGIDIGLWMEGIFKLAYSEEDAFNLKNEIAWHRQQGFNSDWLDTEDLQERVPGVSPEAIGALIAQEDGLVNPLALESALFQSAMERDAVVRRDAQVKGIVRQNHLVIGVDVAGELVQGGQVVIAAGCWSGRLDGLPRPISVEPIRGQMAAFAWPANEPPAIVYGRSGYVLNRGQEAFVGSTMEHVGFDPGTDETALRTVFEAVRQIYPALDTSRPRRTWSGLRPVTPDGRPLVGRDPDVHNLWYATGHGRNGILLAGLTGEIIGQLMTQTEVEYDLSSIDPARFWQF
jgi:glycine/D-amino acid oxidase-like deaminating enzyme